MLEYMKAELSRGVINGEADKAAAFPKFLTRWGRLCTPIGFACLKKIPDYAPVCYFDSFQYKQQIGYSCVFKSVY